MEELPVALDAQEPLHPDDMKALHDMYLKDKSNAQVKFNYAWGLVRSLSKGDQKKGVDLLHEIYKENPNRRRECLYYLALGEFKLSNYKEAKDFTETLLLLEPSNKQALLLKSHINKKVQDEGLLGMAIAGGAVAIIAGIASLLFAGSKKK
ncbi:mitochondrial membrane protein [Boothiomyces macroporosus]|uniref:Mitochondrial fission 1 protein n=1 Tax=Boothiomyces macroporosus TaxID=261099 RepID=A0AAD5UEI3_9FUNG|nr:mitochondrial membrane protein [Boothiomyces macroporosus]